MTSLIENHRVELDLICRRRGVRSLDLFGSAVGDEFDPSLSDLDFVVDFLPTPPGQAAPDYFGLLHDLEDLFDRRIDLLMDRAIRNPYFRREVDGTRRPIYAA